MKIVISKGDGIGPEIMDSAISILNEANSGLSFTEVALGKKVYESGNTSGIPDDFWKLIREHKVLLKGPITTPQGGGYKSLNVTMRKTLGLYANIRPCTSLYPYINTKHQNVDLVIIRENEEDLYAGIEHQQTDEVVQCLKLISRPGTERIIRHAFEYAKQQGRKKVTCFTKDNIMKQTDGLFHKIFDEVSKEYPTIKTEHQIVDIGTAKLATKPENFDVIVVPNLYGDIISDVASEITGSVGLSGSANIGQNCAMFEAIHGSAPDISGANIANPSGLINASVQMLEYLGLSDKATLISNALLKTIEDGYHTKDIFHEKTSVKEVTTKELTEYVIGNLGKKPDNLKPKLTNKQSKPIVISLPKRKKMKKQLVGIDVFVHSDNRNANELAEKLKLASNGVIKLKMITNRGVKVWPNGIEETFCTDHWRCRFQTIEESTTLNASSLIELQTKALANGIDIIKTENLYTFDNQPGFSLGQGQ